MRRKSNLLSRGVTQARYDNVPYLPMVRAQLERRRGGKGRVRRRSQITHVLTYSRRCWLHCLRSGLGRNVRRFLTRCKSAPLGPGRGSILGQAIKRPEVAFSHSLKGPVGRRRMDCMLRWSGSWGNAVVLLVAGRHARWKPNIGIKRSHGRLYALAASCIL